MRITRFILLTSALTAVSSVLQIHPNSFITPAVAQTALPGVTVYTTTPQLPSSEPADADANSGGSDQPVEPGASVEDPDSPARPPVIGDSGDFLRHINGIDASRQGGHGLDPIIRGLDQNQIAITNDGAFHFGGCPNRMDPPTSHMQLYTYDKVTVKKGFQSVLDGPPAPGGSILFERINPAFEPGSEVSSIIKSGGGYNSNGNGREAFVDMSLANDWGFVRGFGSYGAAENYKDGDGNAIRSGFDQFGGGFMLGRTFDSDSFVTFKVENNNVDNAMFPGSGMDAPKTDDWTYQFKGETDVDWGVFRAIKGDLYLTTVDHVMNNFDLRTPPPTAMNMEARTESDTLGGKFLMNGAVNGMTFDVGIDYRDVLRNGKRYADPQTVFDPVTTQSILWPDTSIKETGVFGEGVVPFGELTKLTVGLRYSHVSADADNADEIAVRSNRSANQLYGAFYGANANAERTEDNFSGLVRLEHEVSAGISLFGTASRAVRTADGTERYIASFMGMMGSTSWVGNPDINPEQHHQIELGTTIRKEGFSFKGSAYYNHVTDFIQQYSGQNIGMVPGVGNFTNVSLFRNIDAMLAGVEAEANLQLSDVWRMSVAAAYTYGENLTDDEPLGQIAPLTGRFEIIYDDTEFMGGVRVNAQATQDRIDAASSMQDFGKTQGWATVDLFAAYNVSETFQVSAGVTNLFDETYARHLNKKDAMGQSYQVNEPGRSVYLRAVATFSQFKP